VYPSRVLGAGAMLALLVWAGHTRADLESDALRLQRAWEKQGQATRLKPDLLERGGIRPITLAASLLRPTADCTSVAVLGSPSTNFLLRLPVFARTDDANTLMPEASVAGAAQVTRCGPAKLALAGLAIEMRSPRAVVEVIVANGSEAPALVQRVLPERDPGPLAPFVSSGPPPNSAPLSARSRRIEDRAKREHALELKRTSLQSDAGGAGETLLQLEPGCHRLDVLGMPAPARSLRPVDIDAELSLVDRSSGAVSDMSENADASLTSCVGERTPMRLRFAGSLPGTPVALLHARWALPESVPEGWGPVARGRMAAALGVQHVHTLRRGPVYTSLGVTGVTALPLEVEPGSCYVVAVAALRGTALGLGVTASFANDYAQNHGGSSGDGTHVAFCAGLDEPALLEVEARGIGLVWLLAVWHTGNLPIGEVGE
jgi:hypothetical protein